MWELLASRIDVLLTLLALGWYFQHSLRGLAGKLFAGPPKPKQAAPQRPQQDAPPAPRSAPVRGAPAPDYAALWGSAMGQGIDTWLHAVNDEPDRNPHTAVCGPTGSGKTTLVLAALHQRPGKLVICTPKNAADDAWGGFPAVRLGWSEERGADWRQIDAAIRLVHKEWARRNADGSAPREWLTLVIDEYVTTLGALPQLRNLVIDLWSMGRSVKIRVVVLGTEVNVKAWGIEGRGDVRGNLLFIECAADRTARMCRWGSPPQEIDVRDVRGLAAGPLDAGRVWYPGAMESATSSAMDSTIAPDSALYSGTSTPEPDSATWVAAVRQLAISVNPDTNRLYSTREIQRRLSGNYNRVVELTRMAREDEERSYQAADAA